MKNSYLQWWKYKVNKKSILASWEIGFMQKDVENLDIRASSLHHYVSSSGNNLWRILSSNIKLKMIIIHYSVWRPNSWRIASISLIYTPMFLWQCTCTISVSVTKDKEWTITLRSDGSPCVSVDPILSSIPHWWTRFFLRAITRTIIFSNSAFSASYNPICYWPSLVSSLSYQC